MKTKKVSFTDYDGNEFVYEITSDDDDFLKSLGIDSLAEQEGLSLKLDEEFLRLRDMKNKE